MNAIAQLAERFEKLLDRLPGAIRTPVEREWRPLKELFLQRRPARLLLVGSRSNEWIHHRLLPPAPSPFAPSRGEFESHANGWRSFTHQGRVEYALAIDHVHAAKRAIEEQTPDCFILCTQARTLERDLALLLELHQTDARLHNGKGAPLFAIAGENLRPEELEEALPDSLRADLKGVFNEEDRVPLLSALSHQLPQQTRLEFARVTEDRAVQKEIASSLIRSTSAVCSAIGTQPIPLADFPILTTLQLLMLGGILHIAGREWNFRTVRDFLAALGVNVGAGLLLREGARAAVKVFPIWGNLISGALAGGGTYAIGHAASLFFIEGRSIREARRRLKEARREKRTPLLPPPST